jgi:DNA invertase Pin-like site-specific DNA recombinase
MTILRAGLYERVSTEEQALRGYSIETQIDNLVEYCEKNELKIVDHYTDEGISGAKPPLKRPSLQRLLDDVQAGKVDIILFTKLDRWFRSVKEYFKVQEILDKHGVQWRAIHENYDTTTANGQMAITIFLAVAQNERDRTAERIKVVFEHKRKNKEACFGGPNKPMGYMKVKDENGIRRLVKDPAEEQMTQEFWDILVKKNNLAAAVRHMNTVYGVTKAHKTWLRIARSPFYCGMWEGIEEFCEPYVSKKDWLMVQESAERRRQDTRAKGVYLFSGMIRCPECGMILCGTYKLNTRNGEKYRYQSYRCRFKFTTCTYKHSPSEIKLERWLLKNLRPLMEKDILDHEAEKSKPKKKPKSNLPALKERQRRLNVMYMAGNMSDADYLKEDAELKLAIAKAESEAPPPERDITPLQELLKTDFEGIYKTFEPEEKRRFWRSIIKEIKFDNKDVVDVIFCD